MFSTCFYTSFLWRDFLSFCTDSLYTCSYSHLLLHTRCLFAKIAYQITQVPRVFDTRFLPFYNTCAIQCTCQKPNSHLFLRLIHSLRRKHQLRSLLLQFQSLQHPFLRIPNHLHQHRSQSSLLFRIHQLLQCWILMSMQRTTRKRIDRIFIFLSCILNSLFSLCFMF